MMSGSEQYLQRHPYPFNSRDEYDSQESAYNDNIISSGALSEDITDIDEKKEPEPCVNTEPAKPVESFDLLKLLSGKQNKKKKQKTKSEAEPSPNPDINEPIAIRAEELNSAAIQAEQAAQAATLEELEAKIYTSKKSMAISDFLKRKRTDKAVKTDPVVEEYVEVLSDHEDQETDVNPVEKQAGGVSVRDIFSNFAPKPVKHNGTWRLIVRLRISPAKLAEIKKYEDPFKTRGNTSGGVSMVNMLMKKRPQRIVTLRLPSEFLRSIEKALNPLYTKSSGLKNGKSASNVFAQMMQTASSSAYPKLTPLQKAKELMPPNLERAQMHIYGDEIAKKPLTGLIGMRPRQASSPLISSAEDNYFASSVIETAPKKNQIVSKITSYEDVSEYVASRAPLAFEDAPHKRIYRDFILDSPIEGDQVWTEKFAPKSTQDLLLDYHSRDSLGRWIDNAFAILKTQSTKTPRNVKIRQQQQKQRQRNTMSGFIVDDFDEESDETEEDVFVPVLILQGSHGLGKSASVYAAMNALNGYVYEVNSGQNRSRRELYGPLKEFCTTNIISKTDERSFQQGLVLFEDCDVLFEQDKTFWTAVQDVINFSKRPIIISVEDITVIPRSIWEHAEEQRSILSFRNYDLTSFQEYLWLCCFSQGFDPTQDLLDWIADECRADSYDMRKALMLCQWLCATGEDLSSDEVVSLDRRSNSSHLGQEARTLEAFVQRSDTLSASDVIEHRMRSMRPQDHDPNELLDIYVVDDGRILNPAPEPDELNIGRELQRTLDEDKRDQRKDLRFNQVRSVVLSFISSRTKKLPKILQEYQSFRTSTRSRSADSSFDQPQLETQGLPDTSVCYSMSKTAFLLELTAFCRDWARFQGALDKIEYDKRQKGLDSNIRQVLGWRQFQERSLELLGLFPNIQDLIKSIWS